MTMLVKLKILLTYFADLLFCYQMASNVGFSKYQLVMASVMSVSENIYIYIWSAKLVGEIGSVRNFFSTYHTKKLGIISLTPQISATFVNTLLTFKNSHLPPLNFKKFSLTPIRTN
jgi:hypothetical protein